MRLADALSGRAGAAGVRWVLREAPQRDLLRRELEGLLARGRALGPCRLLRAKFKPGRKLTAYFDVQVESRGGDRCVRPIAVTWQAAGEGHVLEPGSDELLAEARRTGVAAPFTKLQAAVPASGLHILVSPLDPRYPELVRASDPGHVRDLLAPAPRPGIRAEYRVSAVRYRPGQRHVLRYDPVRRVGNGGPGTFFAKLYRNGDGQRGFRRAVAIADWLATSGSPVRAAAPFRHVAAADVVLYAEAPGVPLSALIARGRRDLGRELRHAGEALRLLQAASAALARDVAGHRFDEEVQAIARTSGHIQALLPAAGSRVRAILDRAAELHERLPKEAPVFTHGDYKTDHLFARAGQLTLIDFDTCATADPAFDVGKFLADLDWWYAVSGRSGAGHAKRAFLDGYGGAAAGGRMHRARLYEALLLTKITAHRIPVFRPTWDSDTVRLIEAADSLIGRLRAELRGGT